MFSTLKNLGLSNYYTMIPQDELPVPREGSSPSKQYQYLDSEQAIQKYVQQNSENSWTIRLYLSGIHCAACIWLLEKLPFILKGIKETNVQFASGQIEITFNPSEVSISQIAYALNSLGYPPVPMNRDHVRAEDKRQERQMLYRIGVAAVCASNAMMIAVSLFQGFYTGIEEPYASLFRWSSAVIAAPAVFYSAVPFYRAAFGSLISGTLHIDLPIAAAIIATYISGIITTIKGDEFVYFDSVTTLIFLLLVGRWMQSRAVSKARATAMTPWDMLPTTVSVVVNDEITEKDLQDLEIGDTVEVKPWDRVPSDGVVVLGRSMIDQSFLTGESLPIEVKEGSSILGGCINVDSTLLVKVSKTGSDTRLGKILSDIEKNQNVRTPAEDSANKLSGYFVSFVFVLSIVTYFAWQFIDPSRAFEVTVALLIVTCPCALGLAIPAAVTVSLGRAKKRGIFIRRSDAFEAITDTKNFYFDKTGTLTSGKITVQDNLNLNDFTLSIAKGLSSAAPLHPISKAIISFTETAKDILFLETKHKAGRGVEGILASNEIARLGSLKWLSQENIKIPDNFMQQAKKWEAKGCSISAISINYECVSLFALADSLASGAKELVQYLQREKKEVFILSGDSQGAVNFISSELGILPQNAKGDLFPEQKTEIIKNDAQRNCMIGDGLNDAPAMRESDLSIGLRGGIEATIEVASLYISSGKLSDLIDFFKASKRTKRLIHENLFYSVGYNVLGGGAAMFGLINPLVAAILMPVSSLSIVGYSLLVKTFKK